MTRAVDLTVRPVLHEDRVRVETYTYVPASDQSASMSETIWLAIDADCVRSSACLSIGEARRISLNLAAAADAAERHAAERAALTGEVFA